MNIIGISALFHDSACCLLQDGNIIAAAQEERFSRLKHDAGMPVKSFSYCLKKGNISVSDIDLIAYYEKPKLKISRQIVTGFDKEDPNFAEKMDEKTVERLIRNCLGYEGTVEYHEHHVSHAASSYFFSGYEEAAILVNDGVGEWATTSYGYAKHDKILIQKQVNYPNSLGLFYSTITNYLGFRVNSGEYKVMGLAPYGKAKYVDEIRRLISMGSDGSYHLTLKYYDFIFGDKMYSKKIEKLFGVSARKSDTEITQFHKDVAKSLQVVLHEIVEKQINYLYDITKCENLCMAGGVALNCVANRHIKESGPFKHLFIQPAAGDAGGAIGAAILSYKNRKSKVLDTVFLGTEYGMSYIKNLIDHTGLTYVYYENEDALCEEVAKILEEGDVVGWFQGRMEFGPRALGNRSILADPRNEDMRDRINAMVKKREGFRPFAPVVLEDQMKDHFDIDEESPFMLNTYRVISNINLPAITHVDQSARVQTVRKDQNKKLYHLLTQFYSRTGCPILLNTSFNVRGEPIVENPESALDCFFATEIDYLVINNAVISRESNRKIIEQYQEIHSKLKRKTSTSNFNLYTFI